MIGAAPMRDKKPIIGGWDDATKACPDWARHSRDSRCWRVTPEMVARPELPIGAAELRRIRKFL